MKQVLGFTLVSVVATFGYAQSSSSLSGNVADPSGAAVAGAKVEVTNIGSSAKRSTLTDESGLFSMSQLPPGKYTVTAESPGFSTGIVDALELVINTPSRLSIVLKVGNVTESVAVTAEAAQVNTTDASLGNAVTTKAIIELPFEARNPAGLLALQPGVTYFGQPSDYGRGSSTADRLGGSVNGSKPDQNNITLDGVDVNDQNTRAAFQSVLRVTLDSVQEFRTTTQNPTADQGRGSGAQIALITKSGTNALHGSLYEFHRNTITTANSFFNNRSGIARPKLIRNTFGASLGGPVKRDRLFYFMNYEGRRDASDSTVTQLVPTANLRQGIMRYPTASGTIGTMTPEQLRAVDPAGLGVNPNVLRTLNQYPLPNDDTLGDGYNTAGYRFQASTPVRLSTYITKIDYAVDSASRNTIFLRGNLQNDNLQGTPQFPGMPANTVDLDNSKGLGAGWTSLISGSLVSTFRYGFTRAGHERTGVVTGPYTALNGLANLSGTTTGTTRIIPVQQFSEDLSWTRGKHDVRFGGVIRSIRNRSVNYANVYPRGSVSQGSLAGVGSSLRPADLSSTFSAAFRTIAVDLLGPVANVGVTYNFDLNGQVQPFGAPVRRTFGAEEYEAYVNDSWRVSKSLTVNLGLRYSLAPAIREVNGYQVSPTTDLIGWFEQRANLANTGQSQDLVPLLSFGLANGEGGSPLYQTPKKNLSPRIAVAYSPEGRSGLSKFLFGSSGSSSIRAGFGMFYDLFGMSLMRTFDANAPGLSTQFSTPTTMDLATTPRYTGPYDLPTSLLPPAPRGGFPYVPPSDAAKGFASANTIDQHIKQPYSMNLNFTVGRQFSHGLFVQGSYVGRLSRRSLVVSDLSSPTNLKDPKSGVTYWDAVNQLMRAARSSTPTASIQPNPFFENFYGNLAANGLTATQAVYQSQARTYATDPLSILLFLDQLCNPCSNQVGTYAMLNRQYSGLYAFRSLGGGSYHAMQWTVRKRFSEGLMFDFNYTFGKSIDLTSGSEADGRGNQNMILNAWDTRQNRGVSNFDVTHSVSGFGVYSLPFGKGRKFMNSAGRALDAFVGGWQLSTLYTITSGLPRSVLNTGSWTTNWNSSGFATQIGPVPDPQTTKNAPGLNRVGGPNIFADPAAARAGYDYSYAGQIGQRNGIRGDGFFTVDMSLGKTFVMPYKETHTLQFRWEVFNVPNAVRFDINGASLDVANTGTFGKYSSLLTQPRVMQFGLRYAF
jgi:hypothetical protein